MNERQCQILSHSGLNKISTQNPNLKNSSRDFQKEDNIEYSNDRLIEDQSKLSIEEVIEANHKLCLHLQEVTADRDRLLCELAKLRLEMDMTDLKQISDVVESFPQKPIDRSISNQYAVTSGLENALPELTNVTGCVYFPSHLSQTSSVSTSVMNNSQNQPNVIYHMPQNYAMFNQTQLIHNPFGNRTHCLYANQQKQIVSGQYCYNNPSNLDSVVDMSNLCENDDSQMPSSNMPQHLMKKNSVRSSSDIIKRPRTQSAYELSQDLLDKQIELLERKYGGIRARNAAIVIQRAFRHYTMVKKFASITAMAKAEKRHNRRAVAVSNDDSNSKDSSATGYESTMTVNETQQEPQNVQQQSPRVTILAQTASTINTCLHPRNPPTRSLSMREKRQLDGSNMNLRNAQCATVGPNATSVCFLASGSSNSTHPHVNLLHASEPSYYSTYNVSNLQTTPYFSKSYTGPHEVSFANSSNSSTLDSSLNSSWISNNTSSPHTPYYSAAQIYMRPKGSLQLDRKKVPPEVPKRTSSITTQQNQQIIIMRQAHPPNNSRCNGLSKTSENGSLTSVQSSGSDSSATSIDKTGNTDLLLERTTCSHSWKRGGTFNNSQKFRSNPEQIYEHGVSNLFPANVEDQGTSSHTSAAQYEQQDQLSVAITQTYKVSETIRKRQYRVGLNLFNKKPEKGITYLIRRGFLENTPQGVARFLITRKGLSRQMIGEYLGNLQNQFNMAVLNCFALELDLSGMQIDVALRKFQAYFRMPGEAQKIERLMEVFSQRYCQCNQDIVGRLRSADTVFVLSFAIIMLNTDLHTPNLKPERRMRVEDFIKNLRGIDDCHDIDKDMLSGIYERVKANEFKPGSDHVTQVMKVQATIVGKKPNLALPHRRLVCYCRLYEIPDLNKKERPGVHQREVFLFNDMLVITKIFSKKKCSVTYTFRNNFPLCGMVVSMLDVTNYPFCIQLSQKVDGKILITFNARNEHDRCKFAEDLKESISEMDEMESLRIEAELERQKSARNRVAGSSENRDSGVADVEVCACPFPAKQVGEQQLKLEPPSQQLKRSALSNSLLDINDQFGNDKPQRRGSVGSLDSGMSISFQSAANSGASRDTVNNGKLRFSLSTTSTTSSPSVSGLHNSSVFSPTQSYILPHSQNQHSINVFHQNIQPNLKPAADIAAVRNQSREQNIFASVESGQSTEV